MVHEHQAELLGGRGKESTKEGMKKNWKNISAGGNLYLSMVTLTTNGLNSLIKRYSLDGHI